MLELRLPRPAPACVRRLPLPGPCHKSTNLRSRPHFTGWQVGGTGKLSLDVLSLRNEIHILSARAHFGAPGSKKKKEKKRRLINSSRVPWLASTRPPSSPCTTVLSFFGGSALRHRCLISSVAAGVLLKSCSRKCRVNPGGPSAIGGGE